MPEPVYLDHAATTPVRREVFEVMEPFYGPRFGNPSSVHRWGREARAALGELAPVPELTMLDGWAAFTEVFGATPERAAIDPELAATYGDADVRRWRVRWRVFFMACAELFGYDRGQDWWVGHYLFAARA